MGAFSGNIREVILPHILAQDKDLSSLTVHTDYIPDFFIYFEMGGTIFTAIHQYTSGKLIINDF